MSVYILGSGTAVPAHTMSMQQAAQLAIDVFGVGERQERLLRALYRKSRVENRHTVLPHRIALEWVAAPVPGCGPEHLQASAVDGPCDSLGPTTEQRMAFYEEHAPPMARRAVAAALARAKIEPQQITHLVTVSCTGFGAPGVDIDLIQHFSLSPTTQRVHVGFMGCHGAINGLRASKAFAESDADARVLMCAVECCSLHYRFQFDPDRMLGNALFADGSAAVVCAGSDAQLPAAVERHWSLADTACCLIPESAAAMTWKVGNHGFEMFLSANIPDLIRENLRPWLEGWLKKHALDVQDVQGWAVHPGGPRILQAVQDCLELNDEHLAISREVLASHGNMSSPTILFILDRMQHRVPCVALGFGPGLMAEALLFL